MGYGRLLEQFLQPHIPNLYFRRVQNTNAVDDVKPPIHLVIIDATPIGKPQRMDEVVTEARRKWRNCVFVVMIYREEDKVPQKYQTEKYLVVIQARNAREEILRMLQAEMK